MTRFLATYMGTATAREKARWDEMDPKRRKDLENAAMAAWGRWMATHQTAIVDAGAPIGPTKRASPAGVEDSRNQIAAFVMVEADSHEAAAEMFRDHPHLAMFPGDSVEIMECLPMPRSDA